MNSFIETLRVLGPARLGIMAATAAGILAFFIYLSSRLASPDMALLYADLETRDSGQIVSRLEAQQIPFRLGKDGTQIFVASDQVARMRVAMAEEGLPTGGSIGYEIFDRSEGLGTTSFVQNINHLRALEGELSRTIRSVSHVRQARVHLVLPQRELFSRDRQEPSASIVLTLNGNARIGGDQITAIQHLVAAAVPGLKPQMISIIDHKGRLLARSADENDLEQTATSAEEMRISFEARLARTIEELLERSLGLGNVRAEVAAEIDFDRVTENSEIFDPDGQVVRSTQVVEEQANSQDGGATSVTVGNNLPDANLPNLDDGSGNTSNTTRTEETVNYEITRTTKTHIREAGLVRRLSVAVMVNGTSVANEEGESSYEPRSAEEMEQIAALVRSAAGIDESRGDKLEIVNMAFASFANAPGTVEPTLLGFPHKDIMRIAELIVLGVVAILVLMLVVRPLVSRMLQAGRGEFEDDDFGTLMPDGTIAKPALAGPGGSAAPTTKVITAPDGTQTTIALTTGEIDTNVAEEIDHMIDINQVEGRVRASSVKKIGEIIEKHPEEAVAIIRSWLYQDI